MDKEDLKFMKLMISGVVGIIAAIGSCLALNYDASRPDFIGFAIWLVVALACLVVFISAHNEA